jgi:ATP-binding cassette subfamily B protein
VLREALAVAQAGFVDELPDGVDTIIGEEGLALGRPAPAPRAGARVAARPAVLVLDDPLSALDVDTEALVEDALREVMADTTTLVIAHRPSTVTLADRVALLEEGASPPSAPTPSCCAPASTTGTSSRASRMPKHKRTPACGRRR